MTNDEVSASSIRSGDTEGQQADSAGALVEMIRQQRELERTGEVVTDHEAAPAEATGRGDTAASDVADAYGDAPGAQSAGHNYHHPQEMVPAAGQGATASAGDALLAVLAIDEEQWAKLLADLPLDTLTELLGHAFRVYQRIAVEETNRRFEYESVMPPEPSSVRVVAEM